MKLPNNMFIVFDDFNGKTYRVYCSKNAGRVLILNNNVIGIQYNGIGTYYWDELFSTA